MPSRLRGRQRRAKTKKKMAPDEREQKIVEAGIFLDTISRKNSGTTRLFISLMREGGGLGNILKEEAQCLEEEGEGGGGQLEGEKRVQDLEPPLLAQKRADSL